MRSKISDAPALPQPIREALSMLEQSSAPKIQYSTNPMLHQSNTPLLQQPKVSESLNLQEDAN